MNTTYGDIVRHNRERRGLSQTELADLAHVSRQTIARLEDNSLDIRLSTLEQTLEALALSLSVIPKPHMPLPDVSLEEYETAARQSMSRFYSDLEA